MNVYDKKQKFLDSEIGKTDKEKILKYVIGNNILEIGCGSGVNIDMISGRYPDRHVVGMDISQKVIDTLNLRKDIEHRSWDVVLGDAMRIDQYVKPGSFDTLIFCSVIHELFSYIEWQGKKFNYDTINYILTKSFDLLPKGERIIIRDGVLSFTHRKRHIIFKDKYGIDFFHRYIRDFKGHTIYYAINNNDLELSENDAMEFLYTYTWGYEPYACEVQEQYGYLSLIGYESLIKDLFKNKARIIYKTSYLQDGYIDALKDKVEFKDSEYRDVCLPDSNMIIVIEKL